MFQHNLARPHVARICTQFLEAENGPVLPWPAYSPDGSPIEHVWDALDWRVPERVPVPDNIQQLRTAIEEERDNIPQATINSMRRDESHCMRQMVVTPDTDSFSDPHPYLFLRYLWPTDANLYSQWCEIHRLGPNEFISIVWFPYVNCVFEIVACCIYIFVQCVLNSDYITLYHNKHKVQMPRLRDHWLSAFEVTGWHEICCLSPLCCISTMDSALHTFGNEYRIQHRLCKSPTTKKCMWMQP